MKIQKKTKIQRQQKKNKIRKRHKKKKKKETMSNEAVEYYTIEEGDTLMSISLKMYKSPNYVDALMNANGIKEGDTIYPGEKIAIPSVN